MILYQYSYPLTVTSTFTWTASYGSLTGGAGSGSGDINEILQNITSNPEVAPYSVIPTSSLGCVGNPYIINVTVNPEPIYSGPTSFTICSGDALSINLTSPIASTWNWDATNNVNVSGESTTNQTTSSITDVLINSLSTPENVTYNVQPTSLLGCANSYQTITVTVNPTPTTPTITSNSPVCEGGTLSLTTPLVAGAAYTWSGPNGFSSNLQNPSIVGISSAGAGTYNLVTTLAGCNSSTGTSTVIVNVAPTISIADPGGIGQSICITSPTTSMSANTPIVGTGVWTYISGPSFPTIVNNTAPNTVINDLTAPGNYVFEWTISNGACTPSSSQISVTVDNLPTVADAGIDQSVCEAVGTLSMNANSPIVGIGNWSQLSGPIASIVNVNSPTTVINGLTTPGAYVFEWTIFNGGCPTTSDNVLITIESSPTTSNAGVNQNICASSSSTNLTANTPTIGTGLWSFVSGPGSPTIISPTNPNSLVVGLSAAGSYIFEWTISNGSCTPSTSQVTITTIANPATPMVTSNSPLCEGDNLLLSTPLVAGASYSWTGPGGFTSTLQNPTISSVTTSNAGTYSLDVTVNGCTSVNPGSTAVSINPAPTTAIAGIDQNVCISAASATMAANTPSNGTGTWNYISGPTTPTIVTLSDPNTVVNNLNAAGSYIFEWAISSVGCTPSTSQVTINVDDLPTTANAGVDTTACETLGSMTFFGNSPIVGTGVWTQISGTSTTIASPTSNITSVSGLTTAGTYVYEWTISNGVCSSSSDQKIITLSSGPTIANAGAGQSICISAASATMAANTPSNGTGTWNYISGPTTPTIVTLSDPNTVVNNLNAAGSYIFEWAISSVGCTPSTSQVTINVDDVPTTANAGVDTTACETLGSMTFFGNSPIVGTGVWTQISGTSTTIASPTSNITSVSGLTTAGTYVYEWTISNGVCSSSSDQKIITLSSGPTIANAGAGQSICISAASATMAANTPSNGTGTWNYISGPTTPTIVTLSDPNTIVNNLNAAGSYIFEWAISSVGCTPSTSQVTINVDDVPTTANAGVDTTACETLGSMTFFGNSPIVGTGVWTQISGTSTTIASPTSNITSVSGLTTAGTYVYEWTISNGVCSSSSDQKIITLSSGPTIANAGAGQSICISTASATMAANTPSNGTGTWNYISGPTTPTIVTLSDPNTVVNNLNAAGSYIFEWAISSVGCTPSTSQVTINVDDVPTTANAGVDTTACETLGSMTFFGNSPIVGTGVWTQISGTSTTIASPTSNITSVSGLTTAGTYVYEWTISNGVCSSSSDQKIITLSSGPTIANAGAGQSICISAASATMAANTPSNGTGTWNYISGPTTPTIVTLSDPNTVVNNLNAAGSYIFEWAISSVGCTPSTSQVTINVDDVPTFSDAGLPQSICAGNDTVIMNANTPLIGTGSWMQITGGASIIDNTSSPTTIITGFVTPGTYVYEWVIGNGSCPNSSDQVTITVEEAPTASIAGTNQDICVSAAATTLAANSPIVGTGTWSFVSGPSVPTFVNINSPTTSANGFMMPGVYVLEWTISNGSCTPSSSQVSITVNDTPTAAVAGSDQTICSTTGTVSMNANSPFVGLGSWTQVSGPASTIVDVNSPTTVINGLTTAGVYDFQWEITNGTCAPSTDVVTITINEGPTVNATTPNNVCASESSFNVLGTQNNATSVQWSILSGSGSLSSTTTNASVYTLNTNDQGTTVILLFEGVASGCANASDTVSIVIDPIPNAPTTIDNLTQSICEGTTVNLSASTTTIGANIFWFSNAGLTNQIGVGANVTLGPLVTNGNAYVVSSLNGCVNNNPLIFTINLVSNSVDAGDSVSVCAGSSTTLNGAASGNFYWMNEVGLSDTSILNPTVNPIVDTYYYLVSNNGGCSAMDSVLVYIGTDCETIQVTNTFSPNGDGVNDFFTVNGLINSVALRVTILNRWGDVIADIPNYDNLINRWDGTYNGTPVPEGTYFYIIEYMEGFETSTGWVQVIR
jgi:gliding motility-associated-like protein